MQFWFRLQKHLGNLVEVTHASTMQSVKARIPHYELLHAPKFEGTMDKKHMLHGSQKVETKCWHCMIYVHTLWTYCVPHHNTNGWEKNASSHTLGGGMTMMGITNQYLYMTHNDLKKFVRSRDIFQKNCFNDFRIYFEKLIQQGNQHVSLDDSKYSNLPKHHK